MNASNHDGPVLVLGGTGKTGRRIVQQLTDRGRAVRIGSRSGEPPFDWNDRTTWTEALKGTQAAWIAYQPDLAVPGAGETVAAFSEAALKAGTRRLVLLSGRGEEEAQAAEETLQASGADWTIVRASWFAQNFSESFLLDGVLAGVISLPAGDIREPFVDAEDIADIAVAAFLDGDRHIGELYEVTGPRLLTFAEAVGEIARATGWRIAYEQVTHEAYAAMMEEQAVPADYRWLLDYLFSTVLDGRNQNVADGAIRALGRPATDFSQYVARTAQSGAWRVQ